MPIHHKHIYRRIAVRMWLDERFQQALSPLPPSGQSLWLYLLTCPETDVLPGLFRASRAGLADALGWGLSDFDRCWREIEAAGMGEADWRARLVWLKNALRYNRPESPNVVISWGRAAHMLPECDLRDRAIRQMVYEIGKMGPGFQRAAQSSFPSIKNSRKTTSYFNPNGKPQDNPSGEPDAPSPSGSDDLVQSGENADQSMRYGKPSGKPWPSDPPPEISAKNTKIHLETDTYDKSSGKGWQKPSLKPWAKGGGWGSLGRRSRRRRTRTRPCARPVL